jgi:tetratricopeptide (TPR) repeat protein
MKPKIKFIVIAFIVVMIPLGWIIRGAIAADLQGEAEKLRAFANSQKELDLAMKKINRAIRLAPRRYFYYVTRASIFEAQKKYREAIAEIQKAHKYKPDFAEGYVEIGFNYERLGFPDSAKISYKSAIEAYNKRIVKYSGDREKTYGNRANKAAIFKLLGDTTNANFEFRQLKKEFPEKLELIEQIQSIDKEDMFPKI